LLQLVYANPAAIDDQLLERIISATEQPWALDAFTSIVLSPKTRLSFDQMIEAVQCPVCLAYGEHSVCFKSEAWRVSSIAVWMRMIGVFWTDWVAM
jgi:hypothetical protein